MTEDFKTIEAKVTSIEQLLKYQEGDIVRLPDFAEGQPFYARLKRPSIMKMVEHGTIPNSLLVKTNELFTSSAVRNTKDENMLKDIFHVLDVFADSVFVEPKYKELKDAGIELTDEQMMFVFSYAQQGVKALEPFRKNEKD